MIKENNLYTFATFSSPEIKNFKTNLIGTTVDLEKELNLNIATLRDNLNKLNIKEIKIFDVYSNINSISRNGNYLGYIPEGIKFDVLDFGNDYEKKFLIIPLHIEDFFTKDFYTNYIVRQSSKENIFLFRNVP